MALKLKQKFDILLLQTKMLTKLENLDLNTPMVKKALQIN